MRGEQYREEAQNGKYYKKTRVSEKDTGNYLKCSSYAVLRIRIRDPVTF
jgi:hypothetical protein